MSFETFEVIIRFAIEKEKEAVAFYSELSKEEQFSGIRETFASFAKEEQKHVEMLENFSRENNELYKIEKIPDLKRSDYLVEIKYEQGMSYPDILRLAVKREEKAVKLYSDFGNEAAKEEHKKLFQVLAQEESKHKLKLETIYDDYMAKMGD